jgi:hypothetical protein
MNEVTLRDLERRYKKAVEDGEEQFTFKGRDILTGYCKYLLEFHRTVKSNFNTPFDFVEMQR